MWATLFTVASYGMAVSALLVAQFGSGINNKAHNKVDTVFSCTFVLFSIYVLVFGVFDGVAALMELT